MRRHALNNLLLIDLLGIRIIVDVSRFCCIQKEQV